MRAAWLILALGVSACNSSSPTAPTPPPAPPVSPLPPASSIVSIQVTGGNWIVTSGGPLQMTARVFTRLSPPESVDGTEHVTWSLDPSGLATIDRAGRLTATGAGSVAVIATVGDKSGRTTVRAVPDYSGTWSGDYIVSACSGGHDFRECGRIMFGEQFSPVRYPFTLALSQLQDRVTGTLREMRPSGDIVAPVSGLVRVNGALVIEATLPQPNHEPFRVFNWSSTANAATTSMSGAFTQIDPRRTAFGDPYAVRTENDFANVSRTP